MRLTVSRILSLVLALSLASLGPALAQDTQEELRVYSIKDQIGYRNLVDKHTAACFDPGSNGTKIRECSWLLNSGVFATIVYGFMLTERAQAEVRIGDLETAMSDYDKGLMYWDNDPMRWLPAQSLVQPQDKTKTIYMNYTTHDHAGVYCQRGDLRLRLKDIDGATADYQKAQTIDTGNTCATDGLAKVVVAAKAQPDTLAAQVAPPPAEPSPLEAYGLASVCRTERLVAYAEVFGPDSTPAQRASIDKAILSQGLSSEDYGLIKKGLDGLHGTDADDKAQAIKAYAACLFTERLAMLPEPAHADGQAAGTPEKSADAAPDPFAGLPTRDHAAGADVLAQSLDPNARAQHDSEMAQVEAKRAQALQNSSQGWDVVVKGLVTGVQVAAAYSDLKNGTSYSTLVGGPDMSSNGSDTRTVAEAYNSGNDANAGGAAAKISGKSPGVVANGCIRRDPSWKASYEYRNYCPYTVWVYWSSAPHEKGYIFPMGSNDLKGSSHPLTWDARTDDNF